MEGNVIWLLATDGSDYSYAALQHVSNFCKKDDQVILLMVSKAINPKDKNLLKKEKAESECREKLERFRSKLEEHNIKYIEEYLGGDPREVILECASKHQVNFIAMGSRGLSGLKNIVMGSVSTYVVEHSTFPTFIFK
eukprot:TRINITY_DN1642_c0_g1_i1.p1 TRINITY_DN1642_c0_g1~~TRINITY_DN1642_c0_g1_i1.p1  ORF type:complete len:138 (-),score=37.48 TRINITY_DN1642_c0_g1_i1:53-466(-)